MGGTQLSTLDLKLPAIPIDLGLVLRNGRMLVESTSTACMLGRKTAPSSPLQKRSHGA